MKLFDKPYAVIFSLADVNLGFIISFSIVLPRALIFVGYFVPVRDREGVVGPAGLSRVRGPCARWWLYLVAPSGVAHHSLVLSGLLQGVGPPAKEFLKLKTIFLSVGLFPASINAPFCALSL